MKKILLRVFLFGFIISGNAQGKVNFGVNGGINFTGLIDAGEPREDEGTGYYIGGLAEIPISQRFSILAKVLFVTYNSTTRPILNYLHNSVFLPTESYPIRKYKFSYVEVPILAKLNIWKGLALEAGPYLNFLIKAKTDSYEIENTNDFNLGFKGGVFYRLNNGMFAEAGYFQGISELYEIYNSQSVKNEGFQIGIGYFF